MDSDGDMSYTELESGYQGLKQAAGRPGFYVGHDGNLISLVSVAIFLCVCTVFHAM